MISINRFQIECYGILSESRAKTIFHIVNAWIQVRGILLSQRSSELEKFSLSKLDNYKPVI